MGWRMQRRRMHASETLAGATKSVTASIEGLPKGSPMQCRYLDKATAS